MTYKEFRNLFSGCYWLKCPNHKFDKQIFNGLSKKLFKVYIKAERKQYKSTLFYHECVAKVVQDQSKLNKFIKDRSDAKVEIVNDLTAKCEINEEEIDLDVF